MKWINLSDTDQVYAIQKAQGYSVIFKHSTRCSISLMAKRNFELDGQALPEDLSLYFLDLIAHRDISALVAETFQVHHESPQVLLIKDGQCILDASHSDISAEEIGEMVVD